MKIFHLMENCTTWKLHLTEIPEEYSLALLTLAFVLLGRDSSYRLWKKKTVKFFSSCVEKPFEKKIHYKFVGFEFPVRQVVTCLFCFSTTKQFFFHESVFLLRKNSNSRHKMLPRHTKKGLHKGTFKELLWCWVWSRNYTSYNRRWLLKKNKIMQN